ncbi:MAG: hypothetical protein WBE98_15850, partial [Gammaproteobacteria bacterium]
MAAVVIEGASSYQDRRYFSALPGAHVAAHARHRVAQGFRTGRRCAAHGFREAKFGCLRTGWQRAVHGFAWAGTTLKGSALRASRSGASAGRDAG